MSNHIHELEDPHLVDVDLNPNFQRQDEMNNHDGNANIPAVNIAQVAIGGIRIPVPGPVRPNQNAISTEIIAAVLEGKNLAVECLSDDERTTETLSAVLGLLNGNQDDQVVPNDNATVPSLPRYKFVIANRSFSAVQNTIECLQKFRGSSFLSNLIVVALGHPQKLCEECYDEYCCDLPNAPTDDNCSIVTGNGIVRTIQTLKETASHRQYCNFRQTCQLLSQAHIVICPQEFVVSRPLQEKTKLKLSCPETKTVIIFDDGNNIEDISYREASIRIRTKVLLQVSRNIDNLAQLQTEIGDTIDLNPLRTYFENLAVAIDEKANPPLPNTNQLLATLYGIGFSSIYTIKKHVDTISRILKWTESPSLTIETKQKLRLKKIEVGVLLDAKRFLYGILYMLESRSRVQQSDSALQILKYVPEGAQAANTFQSCYMNFGTIMENRYGEANSIIISSACLPPWSIFLDQLATDTDQIKSQFLAPLYIPRQSRTSCFFGHVISIGSTGTRLKVDHENRSRSSIQNEAGKAVLKLAKILPNGIVVFFPSKKALNDMMAQWKTSCNGTRNIWSQIEDVKHVFWEGLKYPGAEEDAATELHNFREKCTSPENGKTGAILLALHRENVSRLMELTPDQVSCIVSLGIPFHNKEAFHIDTKLNFIGAKYPDNNELATEKKDLWYYAECWNRQNTNFASCIRKDQKWFVGIVLDCRFEGTRSKGLLDQLIPQWNLKDWKRYNEFPKLLDELQVFVDEQTMQL